MSIATGFTLIELLVVIAIIALLIGILLPALGTARGQARKIVDQTQQRSLGQGQALYYLSNDEYFAGPNTTGLRPQGANISGNGLGGQSLPDDAIAFETTATTPTSIMDWISPIIGEELNFSTNRAQRTANIFNDFADPAARIFNDTIFSDQGGGPDEAQFVQYITQNRGYRQMSYLSPVSFQYWPAGSFSNGPVQNPDGSFSAGNGEQIERRLGGTPSTRRGNWIVATPGNYRPKLDRVGIQPSNKVLIMSGTRYLTEDLVLDFDINPSPELFGSFVSSDPHFAGSREYGLETNGIPGGENAALSFRHTGESINTAFFDGHTESFTRQAMMEDMTPFYPSGSIITDEQDLDNITQQTGLWTNETRIQ
ncbi:MAG: prepilin-type N-terminal cleavage/methylation domain-containing protein [Planctomycetota bacterium]